MEENGTSNKTTTGAASPPLKVVTPRNRPNRPLPTDRIAHSKQLDILRAFAVAQEQHNGGPVTYKMVADLVKMHPATPPLATAFFVDNQFLVKAGQQGFQPSQEVLNYASAWQWNPATAATKLAPLVTRAWFSRTLMGTLNLNGSMAVDDAITELSIAAGASPEYRAQLDALLDWMATVGLIAREGNLLRRIGPAGAPSEPAGEGSDIEPQRETTRATTTPIITTALQTTQGTVRFNVSVAVDMEEFAGWQPDRIAAFFAGIAQVLAAKAAVERQTTKG